MFALRELSEHYEAARDDAEFQKELQEYLRDYVGRPTPLYFARRLTEKAGGARIYRMRWVIWFGRNTKPFNTASEIGVSFFDGAKRPLECGLCTTAPENGQPGKGI